MGKAIMVYGCAGAKDMVARNYPYVNMPETLTECIDLLEQHSFDLLVFNGGNTEIYEYILTNRPDIRCIGLYGRVYPNLQYRKVWHSLTDIGYRVVDANYDLKGLLYTAEGQKTT